MIGPFTPAEATPSDFGERVPFYGRVPSDGLLEAAGVDACARVGLERQSTNLVAQHLIIPVARREVATADDFKDLDYRPSTFAQRRQLECRLLYSIAHRTELLGAIREHMAWIANEYGPGRTWFLEQPAHLVIDDGAACGLVPNLAYARAELTGDLAELQERAISGDEHARLVLTDYWEEQGRADIVACLRREPFLLLRTRYAHEHQPDAPRATTISSIGNIMAQYYSTETFKREHPLLSRLQKAVTIQTAAGPIDVTADPTVPEGELRIVEKP